MSDTGFKERCINPGTQACFLFARIGRRRAHRREDARGDISHRGAYLDWTIILTGARDTH